MATREHAVPRHVFQAFLVAGLMMAWLVAAKTTRDSLFLSAYDPVIALPPMMVGASLSSIVMAFVNAKLLARYGPWRVIPIGSLAGVLLHGVEYLLYPEYPGPVAIAVYIHVVAFGSVLLSGFWALANERFDPREARKRFGQIAAFGTAGVLVGGVLTGAVSQLVSTQSLLLLLGGLQAISTVALFAFTASGTTAAPGASNSSLPEVISEAPYLADLAAVVLLAATSASMLEYLFKSSAKASFAGGASLTGFLAAFNTAIALATFAVQVGGSQLWLKRFGPGKSVATLPVAVAGTSLAAMFAPGLIALTVARAVELLLRGSLYRAGYELFYTPMPPAQKRAVKGVIDIGAERLGDGLAGAAVKLLTMLPGAPGVILGFTTAVSALGASLAFALDRSYIKVLEKGLANCTITLRPEEIDDPLTRSVFLRTVHTTRSPALQVSIAEVTGANAAARDPALYRLAELRSGDPARIIRALNSAELEPVLVPQVIQLLDRDDVAQGAYEALKKAGDRIAGQLSDALYDETAPLNLRKRIPKVLAHCRKRTAWDGLMAHLGDKEFEVRARCAKALEKMLAQNPEFRLQPGVMFEIVGRELTAGQGPGNDPRDRKRISHLFTLLGLVLPPEPVRLALRALRAEDRKIQGMALEYLDSVLPPALRDQLAAYLDAGLPAPGHPQPVAKQATSA